MQPRYQKTSVGFSFWWSYIQASLHVDELTGLRMSSSKSCVGELEQEGRLSATIQVSRIVDIGQIEAKAHAGAIRAWLGDLKMISGDWPKTPPLNCNATPFAGAHYPYAPHKEVFSFLNQLGTRVNKGGAFFDVFNPRTDTRSQVNAKKNANLIAREHLSLAHYGLWLAKIPSSETIR